MSFDPFNDHYLEEENQPVVESSTPHNIPEPVKEEQIRYYPEENFKYANLIEPYHINQLCGEHGHLGGLTQDCTLNERKAFVEYLCGVNRSIREAVFGLARIPAMA